MTENDPDALAMQIQMEMSSDSGSTKPVPRKAKKSEKSSGWFENPWPNFPLLETKNGPRNLGVVIKENIRPALIVCFVSIPLSASLGVASNVSPIKGIATSIWAGIIMGIFGSSDYNIVGCSGALSGMMNHDIIRWGPDVVPYLAFFSGCWCLLFYKLRLDRFLFHMPASVFNGFCVGVALIIGLNQVDFAFELETFKETAKHEHLYENLGESIKYLFEHGPQTLSTILFFANVVALSVLQHVVPKIPWIPVSAFLGIIFGYLADPDDGVFGTDINIWTLKKYNGGELLKRDVIFEINAMPDKAQAEIVSVIISGLFICIVAVLETVLSAKVSALATETKFDEGVELRALTIDHCFQGIMGVMPTTGLFLRTNVNTTQGATFRFSQLMYCLIMLGIVLAVGPLISYLPQFSVAAILVTCSLHMVPYGYIKDVFKNDKKEFLIWAIVSILCFVKDPVIGLGVGIVMASFFNMTKVKDTDAAIKIIDTGNLAATVIVTGALSYVNGEVLEDTLRELGFEKYALEVDLSNCLSLDYDGLGFLERGCRTFTEKTVTDDQSGSSAAKPKSSSYIVGEQAGLVSGKAKVKSVKLVKVPEHIIPIIEKKESLAKLLDTPKVL